MKYGLIGKSLGHSYSKLIHEQLDSNPYELLSIDENELDNLLKTRDFLGINVTIPYKETVIKYLDEIDEIAKEIGAVNTIINSNGKLKGYNTDYYGLKELILSGKIEVNNKNCYILGSGGTKNTAVKVLKDLNASSITIVSRNKKDNTITYDEFSSRTDVEIIVNTTPVGMYPQIEEEIINLESFPSLKGVIDVIYNPHQTRLITKAKQLGIKAISGLKMLVNQAIKASELFLNKKYNDDVFNSIYSSLRYSLQNIVLIGLPMSGKSTIGNQLAKELNKKFIDLDEEIEKTANMSITDIFSLHGEVYFRKLEKQITLKYSKETNLVISCGGGIIKNIENVINLKANGILIHLTRDIDKLIYSSSRPLTKNIEEYKKIKDERFSIYQKYQDYQIDNSSSIKECVNKIKEAFNESINY